MAFESLIKNIEEVFDSLKAYAKSNLTYYKLKALEQIANACSVAFKVLLCLVLVLLSLLLFSFAAAIFIGGLTDNYVLGFLIVGGFYFLLALIAIFFGARIVRRPMIRMLAAKMFRKKK